MDISRDRSSGKLFLSQKAHWKKVLCKFNIHQAKTMTTIGQHFKLSSSQAHANEEDKFYMKIMPYVTGIGSLMYGMVCTRPDLTFAVSVINRFIKNPGRLHWEALKWTLRYIRGSSNLGLVFKHSKDKDDFITGFVDADFASNLDTRKSMKGYVFTLYGTTISWKSNMQPVVAL